MIFAKPKKKVLVLWYSEGKNLGDYFLFKTVEDYLNEWGYEVIDMDVGESYKCIAKKACKCAWVWFAGGGIIERWIPDIIRNFKLFHKKSKYVKFGVTGLSIGRFDYSDYHDSINYWIKESSFFYARDSFTTDYLNRLSNSKKVIDSVDVAFANRQIVKQQNIMRSSLGVNFRTMPYPELTGEIEWNSWKSAIKRAHSGPILGIPDQIDVSEYLDFFDEVSYSPEQCIRVLEKIEYGIAMRYHVILIAARMGKICIPIGYCPKVVSLSEQLGIEKLCMRYDGYNQLTEIISEYQKNSEKYKSIVKKNVIDMELRAEKMFSQVKKVLEE